MTRPTARAPTAGYARRHLDKTTGRVEEAAQRAAGRVETMDRMREREDVMALSLRVGAGLPLLSDERLARMVERFRGDCEFPVMTDEVRIATAARYILLMEQLTQRSFEPPQLTAAERVTNILCREAARD